MKTLLATILLLCSATGMAAGTGGGPIGPMPSGVSKTPEQVAAGHYQSGLRYKSRAWKQEEKAARARTPEQRDKLLEKAARNYAKAAEQQAQAMKADPRSHQAANELGYALRKTGDYQQAIQWYDRALQLQPGFLEAVEYRGEAYLAVGNLEAAKGAYMELFRGDRALAGQLLTAMEAWVAAQGSTSVNEAGLTEFARWLMERKQLAALTAEVSLNEARQW